MWLNQVNQALIPQNVKQLEVLVINKLRHFPYTNDVLMLVIELFIEHIVSHVEVDNLLQLDK